MDWLFYCIIWYINTCASLLRWVLEFVSQVNVQGVQRIMLFIPPSPYLASSSLDIRGIGVDHSCHYSPWIQRLFISLCEISIEVKAQILCAERDYMSLETHTCCIFSG
jgi:hypothetical protein